MRVFIGIFILFLFTGCTHAQVNPPEKAAHFPTEKEAKDFLKVGLDKQAVVAKFGEPLVKTPQPNGGEIYYYVQPPYKVLKDENFVYGGFQIYFVNDKLLDFSITHKDVRAPPK
jgi:outer membrane protein assembly factor BamE (lipoprotein component of BamABCDE complex)